MLPKGLVLQLFLPGVDLGDIISLSSLSLSKEFSFIALISSLTKSSAFSNLDNED